MNKIVYKIGLCLLCWLHIGIATANAQYLQDPKAKDKKTIIKKPLTLDLSPFVTGPEQDCENALSLCNLTYQNRNSYTGFGSRQEVRNTCLLQGERNSVWFVFTVQQAGTFGFDIRPENWLPIFGGDDYDFALYDITNASCSQTPNLTPVRCNYSADGQITGLRSNNVSDVIPISYTSIDPPMMPGLNVRVGQTFALIVDNYSGSTSGFRLSATGSAVVGNITPPSFTNAVDIACRDQLTKLVTVNFSHPVRCTSVDTADFSVFDPDGNRARIIDVFCNSGTDFATFIRVAFTTPTRKNGTYRIVHRGDVRDNCNNIMRQGEQTAFNVTHTPSVTANASPLDCNSNQLLLSANAAIEGAALSYRWNGPGGFQSVEQNPVIEPPVGGVYSVIAIAEGCTSASAAVNVNFAPAPTADFDVSTSSICATENISLFYTGTASPQAQFVWHCDGCNQSQLQGPGPFSIHWNTPGNKTIWLITIENGCTSTMQTRTVNVASTPGAKFTVKSAVCAGELVQLTITESNNSNTFLWNCDGCTPQPQGQGPHWVSWSAAGAKNIILTTEGDVRCPFAITSNNLTVVPIPEAPSVNPQNVCGRQNVVMLPSFSSAPPDNVFVYTQPSGGAPIELLTTPFVFSVTSSASTTYYLESVNTLANCKSSNRAEAVINVYPVPAPPAIEDVRRCNAGVVAFTLHDMPNNANEVWLFDSEVNGALLDIAAGAGAALYNDSLAASQRFYAQSYAQSGGCVSERVPINAIILASPGEPSGIILARCGAGEVTMQLSMGAPAGEQFRIYDSPENGNRIATAPASQSEFKTFVTQTTTFYLESYQELEGCSLSSRFPIVATILEKPNLLPLEEIKICENASTQIPITISGAGSYRIEMFEDINANPLATGISPAILQTPSLAASRSYSVRAIHLENNCVSDWQEQKITVSPKPILPTPSPVGRCNPGLVHFSVATGNALVSSIRLYSTAEAANPVAEASSQPYFLRTPLLTTHVTYFLEALYEGCPGERLPLPITVVPVLQLDIQTMPALLGNDGSIQVNASGGMPPYTYIIGSASNQTGSFINLAPGNYTLRVHDAGSCLATRTILVDAQCPIPNPPKVKEDEKGQLVLHWSPSFNAIAYQVTLTEDGQEPGPALMVNDTFIILRRLAPETRYKVELRAVCRNSRVSAPQNEEFTTPLCNAVNFIYMTDVTENSGLVNWSDMEGADSYEFSWRKQGATEWEPLENLRQNNRFLNHLQRNSSYEVQLRTICNEGSVQADIVYSLFTTVKCSSIQNIRVSHLSSNIALLEWEHEGGATSYAVSYAIAGSNNWFRVTTAQPRVQLSGLLPQTSYEIKIRPNCGLDSGFEETRSFTTPSENVLCNAPEISHSNIAGLQAVQISWTPAPNAVSYNLRYGAEGQTPIVVIAAPPYLLTNLEAGKTYSVAVRANCEGGVSSAWSLPVNVRLPNSRVDAGLKPENIIYIYPNPANNVVTLEFKNVASEGAEPQLFTARIIDWTGRTVIESSFIRDEGQSERVIDVTPLAEGVYSLIISSHNRNLAVEKLIIRR
jgi:hypothetical protein